MKAGISEQFVKKDTRAEKYNQNFHNPKPMKAK